jgi:hypothetical protein
MPRHVDPPLQKRLPPPKTLAASAAQDRFVAAYERMLQEVRNISLSVLVWGPSPNQNASAAAKKRLDIKNDLIDAGHYAMFSENMPEPPAAKFMSEKAKEFAQAHVAEFIVVMLEGSPGALAEVHDFANDPEIASKMLVMIPEVYRSGYSAGGAIKDLEDGYRAVIWYGPSDLTKCNLLTQAHRAAEARRHIKYRAITTAGFWL